jgi:two-component system chemotaxis response regulator CheB
MAIRILLVDDSPTFRVMARSRLGATAGFEVVGEAETGARAVKLTSELRPDVVVMDVEMPKMDGYEATRRIMDEAPTPVVIVSAVSDRAVHISLEALRAGALTAMTKPPGPDHPEHEREWRHLVRTVRSMAGVRVVRRRRRQSLISFPEPPAPAEPPPESFHAAAVAIAASTGGPAAVREILAGLPADFPAPVLLVQHIGADFVEGMAEWLDRTVPLEVGLAHEGEELRGGRVYIAPPLGHLTVGPGPRVRLSGAPPIGGFRPSATATYTSVAEAYGNEALGVILTGMGRDGVAGLRTLRSRGGRVLAQDEATSVVHSMPGNAIRQGLTHTVLPLGEIPGYLLRCVA